MLTRWPGMRLCVLRSANVSCSLNSCRLSLVESKTTDLEIRTFVAVEWLNLACSSFTKYNSTSSACSAVRRATYCTQIKPISVYGDRSFGNIMRFYQKKNAVSGRITWHSCPTDRVGLQQRYGRCKLGILCSSKETSRRWMSNWKYEKSLIQPSQYRSRVPNKIPITHIT